MDLFEGKNKRYRKQLIKFGEAKFYEVSLGRATMFVVSHLATPRVIASFLALKCALEPMLLMEILLF